MSEENTNKDTEIYKAIIKSQFATQTEICEVIQLLYKDRIVCKAPNKQFKWYVRNTNNTLTLTHEAEIRRVVFPKLITIYNQTAEFLYTNAFCEGKIIKYHYIDIANRLVHISKDLQKHSNKNAIMRELCYVMYSDT